ncbi:MAG TPA: YicC/YloC family endoribonuclease, partial [Opitutaceae bacterium]
MRSMTGYGRASAALGGATITVQVSSVNRRSLDLSVKLPGEWESLEAEVGERIRRAAARGKVHVDIEYSAPKGGSEVSWSDAGVGDALDRLAALANSRHIPFEPTAELLWQVASSQRSTAGT